MSSGQTIIVWGEVLWDLFPEGPELGGAPANAAWHLGLAGGWARLVSRVGDDDLGKQALARLGEVCDTSLIQIDPDRQTGVVEVTVRNGEPSYRLVPDRAWQYISCTDAATQAIAESSAIIYGTLAQHTAEGLDAWRAAMTAADRRCLKICDVNLRKSDRPSTGEQMAAREGLACADVVKLNDRERDILASWFGTDPISELLKRPRVVALTHGARGATIFGAGDPIDLPSHSLGSALPLETRPGDAWQSLPRNRVGAIEIAGVPAAPGGDNVGCGDAFLAIIVYGMTLGWDLATCGKAASRWAAAVAEVRGATPRFSDERIAELLDEQAA